MSKSYYAFMAEISSDELYDRLVQYGMFSEKLPPILTAESFLEYCKTRKKDPFQDRWYGYITYENMRNTNIPRNLGVPTPMGHELLCRCLADNWYHITEYFKQKTEGQKSKISRTHIRKRKKTDALFEMNYKNWRTDGNPEPDIYMGKKYMVHADISKCYPSIYTHAIPWALVGKQTAKNNPQSSKNRQLWYNKIDHFAQISKKGETHGILIGPHTSNILSEIILCAIDFELFQKYKNYVRNIDDYVCYVDTKEEAEQFIIDLNRELRKYDLLLNHQKTEILEMPLCLVDDWVHKIQNQVSILDRKSYINYKEVRAYIDFNIKLASENSDNQSVLLYAIKVLQSFNLSKNAKDYLIKSMVSLALLYPYLVPILGEYVFKPYQVDKEQIGKFANLIFNKYIVRNNYEACSYAILYAIHSEVLLSEFNLDEIIDSKDCILLLLSLIYCRNFKMESNIKKLKQFAKNLINENDNYEMDQYWLFVYECLGQDSLKGEWKAMKKENVSFLKPEYY